MLLISNGKVLTRNGTEYYHVAVVADVTDSNIIIYVRS